MCLRHSRRDRLKKKLNLQTRPQMCCCAYPHLLMSLYNFWIAFQNDNHHCIGWLPITEYINFTTKYVGLFIQHLIKFSCLINRHKKEFWGRQFAWRLHLCSVGNAQRNNQREVNCVFPSKFTTEAHGLFGFFICIKLLWFCRDDLDFTDAQRTFQARTPWKASLHFFIPHDLPDSSQTLLLFFFSMFWKNAGFLCNDLSYFW